MINKDYLITRHARERMRERDITLKDVESAIEDPEISYKGRLGEMNAVKELCDNKKIRVVYRIKGKKIIIITAIWKK